ncbi:MAG: hypothetical protein IJZ74_08000 [Clostridia bacterium]|nr:hypothetical protein [Clostridia bacterium]
MKKLLLIMLSLLLCVPLAVAEGGMTIPVGTAEPPLTDAPAPEPTPTPYFAPNAVPTATPMPTPVVLPDDPFMTHAIEIAYRIELLAENNRFLWATGAYGVTEEMIESVSFGEHIMPSRIFHVSGDALAQALYSGAGGNAAATATDLTLDFTRPELRRDLVESLPQMLWGVREESELYLLMILSRCKIFASPDTEGCGFFIMLYEGGAPVMLPWYAEGGAVSLAAMFLPDDELEACMTAEEVSAWFAGRGMPPVAFEEVKTR